MKKPFVSFCTDVLHLKLTPAWRVLLRVAVDGIPPGQLRGTDREMARGLFGDVDDVSEAVRLALVFRLGRGSGKSTIAAALGVWVMATADLHGIGPGMLAAAVVVAPTRRTATITLRVARELVRAVPALERMVADDGDTVDSFQFVRAGRRVAFQAVAATKGGHSLRGFDILAIVFDESEFFASNDDVASAEGYAVSDRDLYAAAKPRLRGPALFISTPWPCANLTSDLFDRNHGHPVDALAAVGSTTTMRPDDARLARAVEQEMARDPENASREYHCIPGARGGSRLIDADAIDAARDESRPLVVEAPPGSRIGCGGDLGLERDSSAIVVVSSLKGAYELLESDEIKPTRRAPLTPGYVIRDRFALVMRRHGVTEIVMDAHYRQSAIEHLTAEGLRFRDAPTGAQGKYDTHMVLRDLLHSGKLRIGPSAKIASDLKSLTHTALPGGGTKISFPRRAGQGHGDTISALALAVWKTSKLARGAQHTGPVGSVGVSPHVLDLPGTYRMPGEGEPWAFVNA